MSLRLSVLFFILCCLPAAQAAARTDAEIKQELKEITEKIQTLDKKTKKQQSTLEKLQSQLEILERKISTTARSKHELKHQLHDEKQSLRKIEADHRRIQENIARHQRLLAGHLRAQHRQYYRPHMDLLDHGGARNSTLTQTWFRYLQQARRASILELDAQRRQLQTLRQQRQQALDRLASLENRFETSKEQLIKQKKQRRETVEKLARQLKSTQQELKQLKQNRAKLNKLLEKLRKTLADPAFSMQGKVAFAKLRGKLPWPVKGKVSASRDARGVRIRAAGGLPVRAISAGRIVYADWLRGFGLLTIIDHGDGYMSLYGHNETLLKQVGDWVDAGTVISTTGNSGGRQSTGLYFEIRHNSKPLPVKKWCKSI